MPNPAVPFTADGQTHYTPENLRHEARSQALSHARDNANGRPFSIGWEIVLRRDAEPFLLVSYAANGRGGKCGLYTVRVAL